MPGSSTYRHFSSFAAMLISIILVIAGVPLIEGFQGPLVAPPRSTTILFDAPVDPASATLSEAERLQQKAQQLRDEIARAEQETTNKSATVSKPPADTEQNQNSIKNKALLESEWSLPNLESTTGAYRLYVDIGREPGTWMEPRWGASGRRLEFTLDVQFTSQPALAEIQKAMVQDNLGPGGSTKSAVYELQTAPKARLRKGFDEMKCSKGGFRLDQSSGAGVTSQQQTARFFIQTMGKQEGDLELEAGAPLYFSLPVFGNNSLSRKEGIVSVRQMGWHTGWYREESRIVGVFRAVPLEEAQQKDGF